MSNEMELNGQQAGQPVQADANPSGNGAITTFSFTRGTGTAGT